MKRFSLSSVLIFSTLFAFAQITIRGTVTDCERWYEGLNNAFVHIVGTDAYTTTDLDGNFELEYQGNTSAEKNYMIKFSHRDFEDEIRTVKISGDNSSEKIYTVNICLKEKREEIEMYHLQQLRKKLPPDPEYYD